MIENARLDLLLTQVNCRITSITRLRDAGAISNSKAEKQLKQKVELRTKFMRQIDRENFLRLRACLGSRRALPPKEPSLGHEVRRFTLSASSSRSSANSSSCPQLHGLRQFLEGRVEKRRGLIGHGGFAAGSPQIQKPRPHDQGRGFSTCVR